MNAKVEEEAQRLIGHFRFMLLPFITFQTQLTEEDLLRKCIQCAIFCVKEILENILKFDKLNKEFYEYVLSYLNEIK